MEHDGMISETSIAVVDPPLPRRCHEHKLAQIALEESIIDGLLL